MAASLIVAPLKIDPAVWRIEIPLIVQQRCDSPIQICVWMALRWLRAAYQHRKRGFGIREIAKFAKIDPKSVTAAAEHLLEMGLITLEGEERQAHWRSARPVYGLPLDDLEQRSIAIASTVLAQWGITNANTSLISAEQARIDFETDPKTVQSQKTDPKTDQFTDPKTDQSLALIPKTDQSTDPKTDRETDPKTDHMYVSKYVGREVGSAHAQTPNEPDRTQPDSEPSPPIPPPPAPDQPTLGAHPLDLWRLVRPDASAIDQHQLALFAAEHDPPTADHGWYWVGRAILTASLGGAVRSVNLVKVILDTWRAAGAYGSDTPAYTEKIRNGRSARSRRDAQPGPTGRVPAADKQPAPSTADTAAPVGSKPFVFDDSWSAPAPDSG